MPSNFRFALTGATALAAAGACTQREAAPQPPLNVVYIMCDDHSYQTISAYDQRYMRTPNIDRLADEGARFTNSFVANSLSGPSRACLLTGKHSHANGFTNNEHGIFDGSQQTLQKLLQVGGYQTAMVGKWHLVSDPTGFDYWDILTGQGDYYNPVFIRNGEKIVRPGYS
ncbi:MAG: sulfatase-like hydrolase/transferase, partial [Bacteroidales bacterium]|nr:sulfatase-like hydrolase/transferase [Bacteroidales bacterium]